jgi:hypothetical protein
MRERIADGRTDLVFEYVSGGHPSTSLLRKLCYGRFSIRPNRLSMDAYLLGSPRK